MKKLFFLRKISFFKKKYKKAHYYYGVKRLVTTLDFFKPIYNCAFKVRNIFYDTIRSCFVALLCFLNGSFCFVVASKRLNLVFLYCFQTIDLYLNFQYKTLNECFIGECIFNVENIFFKGGALARSAGVCCLVLKKVLNGIFFNSLGFFRLFVCTLKLPSNKLVIRSGFLQLLPGVVSNSKHKFSFFNKAGTSRKLGFKLHVRGVAMNPVDHPHGGNTSGGRSSVSFKSILCKGFKTKRFYKKKRLWLKKF